MRQVLVLKQLRDFLRLMCTEISADINAVKRMNDLIENIDRLHTTDMGGKCIRQNLGLNTDDIVPIVRGLVLLPNADILRRGKNWYVYINDCIITINAGNFSIITAHRQG